MTSPAILYLAHLSSISRRYAYKTREPLLDDTILIYPSCLPLIFLSLLKTASWEKERGLCNGLHFGSQMKGREYLELWERLTAYEKKCLLIDSIF
jgi:hypothetical protein